MILLSFLLFLKPHHLHQKRDDHEHMVKVRKDVVALKYIGKSRRE
jgi:hypothetical protein